MSKISYRQASNRLQDFGLLEGLNDGKIGMHSAGDSQ
jgi:hypothetical protein